MTRAARFSARSGSDYDVDSTARDVNRTIFPDEPPGRTAFRTLAFGDVEGQLWGAAMSVAPNRPGALILGGTDASVGVPAPAWTVRDRVWSLSGNGSSSRSSRAARIRSTVTAVARAPRSAVCRDSAGCTAG